MYKLDKIDVDRTNRNILLEWDYVMDTSRSVNLLLDVSMRIVSRTLFILYIIE